MLKGLLLLADGFEETEAIATRDVLVRTHEIVVDAVSISQNAIVESSNGIRVVTSLLLSDIQENDYDFVILPGGKRGVANLASSQKVLALVQRFYHSNKYVCAICAAPSILGGLGMLDGKKYTCFPGFQKGKGEYIHTGSVVDGKIITGHSMYYSVEFGETIVKTLLGEEALAKIAPGTKGISA